jgi:hypothetical protein
MRMGLFLMEIQDHVSSVAILGRLLKKAAAAQL